MNISPITGKPTPGEVIVTPPLRPMLDVDEVWCERSDRVTRQYLRQIERVAGTGAKFFELGTSQISVYPFPRGLNKAYLTNPWLDPGGWLIATFHIVDEATLHLSRGTVWMSICPMELQSHVNPIKWATGRVLVFGLGMGYYLREILRKRNVTQVTVVEREASAIRLYKRLFGCPTRVQFVTQDAFEYRDTTEYDFAYVDIWREMEHAKPDVPKLVPRFRAKTWAYWGMERQVIETYPNRDGETFLDLLKTLACPVSLEQARDIAALVMRLIPGKDSHGK